MAVKKASGLVHEPGIRERSPGRYQLRMFNKATGKQVARTFTRYLALPLQPCALL